MLELNERDRTQARLRAMVSRQTGGPDLGPSDGLDEATLLAPQADPFHAPHPGVARNQFRDRVDQAATLTFVTPSPALIEVPSICPARYAVIGLA